MYAKSQPSADASSCIVSFGSDRMLLHDDKFDTQVVILSRQAQDVNDRSRYRIAQPFQQK